MTADGIQAQCRMDSLLGWPSSLVQPRALAVSISDSATSKTP
jgi:hypothetical protein